MSEKRSVTLVLPRGVRTYGVKFNGALDETEKAKYGAGVYIAGFEPGSLAHGSPDIIEGWQVTKINSTNFRDKTMFDLKKAVSRGEPGRLYLELESNPELFRTYNMVREVTKATNDPRHPTTMVELELGPGPNGCFGLRFGGVLDVQEKSSIGFGGIVLLDLPKPGSPAAHNTDVHLSEFLQIININGIDCTDLTLMQVVPVFKEFGDTLLMVLRENVGLEQFHKRANHVLTEWQDALELPDEFQ
eukprot:m.228620 g.228620  ORF g.228620 m.228620 type:complete len:245 (-) comp33543_c0_seq1:5384-6118(-)